jgi:hypothetical protein
MAPPSTTEARRRPRRQMAWGCVGMMAILLAAGLAFVVLLVWFLAGGAADADDLRPLPTGVEVVHESTDAEACPGNGNGWFLCHRAVSLRDDGDRSDDLLVRVVAHYRTEGHRLEPLSEAELHDIADGPVPRHGFGRRGCLDDGPRGRVRCLVVTDDSRGVVEVSMLSWVYGR